MILISICPNLHNEAGHVAGYAKAVTVALDAVSMPHWVLAPVDCAVQNPPANWLAVLPVRKRGGSLSRARYWSTFADAVVRSLADIRARETSDQIAVMMESFTVGHLASVMTALSRTRPTPAHLCLLYRSTAEQRHLVGLGHRALIRFVSRLCKFPIALLSDSQPLEQSFRRFFARPVFTLPIPHTHTLEGAEPASSSGGEILCWWPGSPRPIKGPEKIRALAQMSGRRKICLMISRQAGLTAPAEGSVRIVETADPLSEHEYASLMKRSEVILLPYDPAWYRESTSGIFVEAVCAGKNPVVTAGTWMAYELSKFALDCLVLDWSCRDLPDPIANLLEDPAVQEKLARMRSHYLGYHNPRNYGFELRKILLQSQ